jgi:hypothetical protein
MLNRHLDINVTGLWYRMTKLWWPDTSRWRSSDGILVEWRGRLFLMGKTCTAK